MKAQGAIELSSRTTAGTLVGQGATEYLVLLAVVLIVALVSVALLGFFPGMASDAQQTQSKTYWQSAQPISITESAARLYTGNNVTYPYLRLRNNGAYPIRVTGVIAGDGAKTYQVWGGGGTCGPLAFVNISDYYYLAPGEEKYFGQAAFFGTPCSYEIYTTTGGSTSIYIGGASSVCQNSPSSPGTLDYKSFGFEYIEYLDNNQQITKRQVGKELAIKCIQPF